VTSRNGTITETTRVTHPQQVRAAALCDGARVRSLRLALFHHHRLHLPLLAHRDGHAVHGGAPGQREEVHGRGGVRPRCEGLSQRDVRDSVQHRRGDVHRSELHGLPRLEEAAEGDGAASRALAIHAARRIRCERGEEAAWPLQQGSRSSADLLPCPDYALLIRRDALHVLDLALHDLDGVGRLYIQRDCLSSQRLHKDLRFGKMRTQALLGFGVFTIPHSTHKIGNGSSATLPTACAERIFVRLVIPNARLARDFPAPGRRSDPHLHFLIANCNGEHK
jgi:hypothetical protein